MTTATESPEAPYARHVGYALILLFSFLFFILQAASSTYVSDDSYITFRYARNLVAYGVLTWNPGVEMVDGYTSTLNTLFLALFHSLGYGFVSINSISNILLAAGTFAICYVLMLYIFKIGIRYTAFGLLLLSISTPLQWYITAGFEAHLFTILYVSICSLIFRYKDTRNMNYVLCMLYILLALTRPEGVLISLTALIVTAFYNFRQYRKLSAHYIGSLIIFLFAIAIYVAIKNETYGHPLPNTYYAKLTATRLGKLLNGLEYLWIFVLCNGGVLLFSLLALPAVRHKIHNFRRVIDVSIILLATVAFIVVAGGDSHGYSRFFCPVLPVIICITAVIFAAGNTATKSFVGILATVFVFTSFFTEGPYKLHSKPFASLAPSIGQRISKGYANLINGRWPVLTKNTVAISDLKYLRSFFPPNYRFAHEDVGFVGLYLDRTLYDVYGLNDKEIAHLDVPPNRMKVWGKHSIPVVVERAPEVWFIPRTSPIAAPAPEDPDEWPQSHSVHSFFKNEDFQATYKIENVPMPWGRYWPIFMRKDISLNN